MISTINIVKIFLSVLLAFILAFTFNHYLLAWTEPSATPPGGNVSAPINVSGSPQTKLGNLTIGGPGADIGSEGRLFIQRSIDTMLTLIRTGAAFQTNFRVGQTDSALVINADNSDTIKLMGGKLYLLTTLSCSATTGKLYTDSAGQILCGTDQAGGGLPAGTSGQTLRHNGTNWIANSNIYNNGTNVGIGMTSPGYKLDVSGDIRSISNIYANDKIITSRYGHAGTYNSAEVQGIWSIGDAYQIDTSLDTFGNLYGMGYAYNQNGGSPFPGQHQIVFTNGGTINAAIGLTSGTGYFAGNVGIGVTIPSQKLHVVGNARISSLVSCNTIDTNASGDLICGTDEGGGVDEKVKVSSNDTTAGYLNGKLVAGTNITLTENNNGGNETLTISSSGGIGGSGVATRVAFFAANTTIGSDADLYWDDINNRLGIGTAGPASRLDVSNSADEIMRLSRIGANPAIFRVGGSDSALVIRADNSDTIKLMNGQLFLMNGANCSATTGKLYTGSTGQILCGTDQTGAGLPSGTSGQTLRHDGTNRIANSVIYNNGTNVGIGTTLPNRKLDVVGQILAKTNDALDEWIEFWPVDSAIITKSNNPIRFGHATTPDAAGWSEKMRIDTAGNVGIGTTDPNTKLQVHASSGDSVLLMTTQNTGQLSSDGLYVGITNSDKKAWFWNSEFNGPLGLGAGDVERLTILSNGNVGIGVIDPDAKLEIAGKIKIVDGTQGNGKVLTSDSAGLASWKSLQCNSAWRTPSIGNGTASDGISNTPGSPADDPIGGTASVVQKIDGPGQAWGLKCVAGYQRTGCSMGTDSDINGSGPDEWPPSTDYDTWVTEDGNNGCVTDDEERDGGADLGIVCCTIK